MNTPFTSRLMLPLLAAFSLSLAALGLSSCSCESCSGYGYVRASGLGCPPDPQRCVLKCLDCGATGNSLGMGSCKDKGKAREEVDKLNVLCID